MTPAEVLTGRHFMNGDIACAESAMAAGCRLFFGGYPITPSTEVAERMSRRLPEVGGVFIQMEDELASIAAILGASSAGSRHDSNIWLLFQSDAVESGAGGHGGNSLCDCQHSTRFAFNGFADHGRAGRCDAGKVGFAWRL